MERSLLSSSRGRGEAEEVVAGEDLAGVGGEGGDEVDLHRAEVDGVAGGVAQAEGAQVEAVGAEARAGGGGGAADRAAAEDGGDAGGELGELDRLGEVVVGADLEADDAVDEVAGAGQDDDAGVVAGAQVAGELEAGLAGEADVEDEEVGDLARGEQRLERGRVLGGDHVVAGAAEVVDEHLADFPVVVDDGDAGHWAPRAVPGRLRTIETNPPRLGNRLKHPLPRVGAKVRPLTGANGRPQMPQAPGGWNPARYGRGGMPVDSAARLSATIWVAAAAVAAVVAAGGGLGLRAQAGPAAAAPFAAHPGRHRARRLARRARGRAHRPAPAHGGGAARGGGGGAAGRARGLRPRTTGSPSTTAAIRR